MTGCHARSFVSTIDIGVKWDQKESTQQWNEKDDLIIQNLDFVATFDHLEAVGTKEVWDVSVDDIHMVDANGFCAHNSGEGKSDHSSKSLIHHTEQPLESHEVCMLMEVFPGRCENIVEFQEALEMATFYITNALLLPTHIEKTNEVIARNHRIGIAIGGKHSDLLDLLVGITIF